MSKQQPEERLWVSENGSIYVAEYDTIRSEFPGQKNSIPVRVAIAFNVGETLANHIVKVHNDSLCDWDGNDPVVLDKSGSYSDLKIDDIQKLIPSRGSE